MGDFILLNFTEVKNQFGFLHEYEGFNQFGDWKEDDCFIVATGNVQVGGHFFLDVYENKIKKKLRGQLSLNQITENTRIEGIIINGSITCKGCIINEEGDYGPFLFVAGDVICQSLLLGGSYATVNGNISAEEIIMCHYNHGYFTCKGDIQAPVFIVDDHHTSVAKQFISSFYYNSEERDHPVENESYEDEGTGDYVISKVLVKLLDNSLTNSFEDIRLDLAEGEYVLRGQAGTIKDFAYWEQKINQNYRNLKRVPSQYKTKELCMLALKKTFHALPFVPLEFIDTELCNQLVEKDGLAIQLIPQSFITANLCLLAAKAGTFIKWIPEKFLSEEMIVTIFTYSKTEPDIKDVPAKFITENILVNYVMLSKGLWLAKACEENNFDKLSILKKVIDKGILHVDKILGFHCTPEAFAYAKQIYSDGVHRGEWKIYVEKYHSKLMRLGLL